MKSRQRRDPPRRQRGGRINGAIADLLAEAVAEAGLPADAVQLVDTTDRAAVGHFLACSIYRPGDSPRRRKPDPPRERPKPDAGNQAFRRQLPRLCRPSADPTWPKRSGQRQVPADGRCNAAESLVVHVDVVRALLPRVCRTLAARVESAATRVRGMLTEAGPATRRRFRPNISAR